ADLNGDRALDLVITGTGVAMLVFFNDGQGHFSRSSQNFGATGAVDLSLADLDGDGDNDIAVANGYDEPNQILLNDGKGTFSHHQWLGMEDTWSLVPGDLDNDGDLDLFSANRTKGTSRIWLNQTTKRQRANSN
ncbi:MAG: VCBS repeat-containing protein, partial [Planctomycetaceae bacterium]|nr:VCBS repeat-containing protein [Planctomycetaceae bacterium]